MTTATIRGSRRMPYSPSEQELLQLRRSDPTRAAAIDGDMTQRMFLTQREFGWAHEKAPDENRPRGPRWVTFREYEKPILLTPEEAAYIQARLREIGFTSRVETWAVASVKAGRGLLDPSDVEEDILVLHIRPGPETHAGWGRAREVFDRSREEMAVAREVAADAVVSNLGIDFLLPPKPKR